MLKNENGAVVVMMAFLMTIIIGILALSLDYSLFLSKKRNMQNAADAAALKAATILWSHNGTEEEAKDAALDAIQRNLLGTDANRGVTIDSVELAPNGTDTRKKLTVKFRGLSDRMFSGVITKTNEQGILVSSTVGVELDPITKTITKTETVPGGELPNGAIEAGKQFTWSGDADTVITGGIKTGGEFILTNAATFNGDISADGGITIRTYNSSINGNLYSGSYFLCTTQPMYINGSINALGSIVCNTGGIFNVNGDVHGNNSVTLNSLVQINGDVLGQGDVTITPNNGSISYVNGDVRSNTKATNSWGAFKVGGNFYIRNENDIYSWTKSNMASYSGRDVFVLDTEASPVSAYEHEYYNWQWDKLANAKHTAVQVTQELYNGYLQDVLIPMYGNSYGQVWSGWNGGNIAFYKAYAFQEFCDYCHDKTGKDYSVPIYFPGSLTFNTSGGVNFDGCVIAERDITCNDQTDFVSDGTCLMSISGNITLGNSGYNNKITGSVIALARNARIQMNGGGEIIGGVLCKGNITMNGKWNIIADNTWQKHFDIGTKTITTTETITDGYKVTNMRIIR